MKKQGKSTRTIKEGTIYHVDDMGNIPLSVANNCFRWLTEDEFSKANKNKTIPEVFISAFRVCHTECKIETTIYY